MYQGRHFNREEVYLCGDYIDAEIYPVYQPAGKRRSKCRPTSEIQARLNQKNAEKKLTRIIHMNFTEEDIALHLTYRESETPENEEETQRDVQNYIRRLKRRYKKAGIELKYIYTTEYGKMSGRVHHHLIVTGGVDRDTLEKLWGKGYANSKRLQFEDEGVTGLAKYIAKDHAFYRRWSGSRNLEQPVPQVFDGHMTMDDIEGLSELIESGSAYTILEERYPGFILTEANWYRNPINRGLYISYEMRRDKYGYSYRGSPGRYAEAGAYKAGKKAKQVS